MKTSKQSPLLFARLRQNRLAQAIGVALATLFTLKIAEAEAEDAVVTVDSDDLNQPSAAGLDIGQIPGASNVPHHAPLGMQLLTGGAPNQFYAPSGGSYNFDNQDFESGPYRQGQKNSGTAIYLGGGAQASGSNTSVTAHNAHGIAVDGNSSLSLDNLTMTLSKDPPFINSQGQWSYYDPDGIILGSSAYSNSNGYFPGVGGSITLTNSTIQSGLVDTIRANADSELHFDNVTITGTGGIGVMRGTMLVENSTFDVTGGGLQNNGNSIIRDSTLNMGSSFAGVGSTTIHDSTFDIDYGNAVGISGTAELDRVRLTGESGLAMSDGTLSVRDSSITARHGVAVELGDLLYGEFGALPTRNLTFTNTTMTSHDGAGIGMSTEATSIGDILLQSSRLETKGPLVDADMYMGSNHTDGRYQVTMQDSYLSSSDGIGFTAQNTANLDVRLIDSELDLGDNGVIAQASAGSQISLSSQGTQLKGMTALDATPFNGYDNDYNPKLYNARLDLALQDATWTMTGDSNLTDLTMNSGSAVQFQPGGAFKTLTIEGDLNGSGMFAMNTNLASEQGDLLQVLGSTNGSHTLFVADSGNEPSGPNGELLVVDTNNDVKGGNGTFALHGQHVDAGAFRYTLEQQGDDWFLRNTALVPVQPDDGPRLDPRPNTLSDGANAALGNQSATATLWSAEMNALVKRLGELRMGEDNGGVWARGIGKTFEVDNGSSRGYDQNVHGLEVGADTAIALNGGKLYVGGMIGAATSDQDFGDGSSGTIDSKLIGAYATWLDDNGYYVDTVAKYNRLDNEVKTLSNTGEQVKGSYDTDGYGADVEVGKHIKLQDGWFIEPQAELTYTHTEGADYTASNGLNVEAADSDSLQGRVGALFGKSMKLDNGMTAQPYVKASYVHEFNGDSSVTVNGFELDNQVSGSRSEIGFGSVLQVSEKTKVSLDVEHAKGNSVEEPWAVNIGVRFLW